MMKRLLVIVIALLEAACGGIQPASHPSSQAARIQVPSDSRSEVVLYAMGLIDIDYRFGGSNPASGLDCSGMVDYIFQNAVGLKLPHSAYQIAQLGRDVDIGTLQPGDLVFFNTSSRPFSHVGLYIGDGKFIHAPNNNGKIKTSSIKSGYYAEKLAAARTFFAPQ